MKRFKQALKYSPVALTVVAAPSFATVTSPITAEMIQPIADAMTSTVATVIPIAFGVLGVVLAAKAGFSLVKGFFNTAKS